MCKYLLLVVDLGYKMCFFPIKVFLQPEGRPKLDPNGDSTIPCGKCDECLSKRAIDWATRCSHEISCHEENSFLTLTYDDDNLPSSFVIKDLFKNFIKRLRKEIKTDLRYIVSHEYGSQTQRPHHHMLAFGYNPSNQEYLRKAPSGEPLFTSDQLLKLWPHGYHSIGTANEKTAYYIASYSLKSAKHIVTHPDSGEPVEVTDSMDASKNPAVGFNYFIKNAEQLVYSGDPLPRYYLKLLQTAHERLEKKLIKNHPISDDFKKFVALSDTLLQDYENNLSIQLDKNYRGSRQLHAKYVINKSKLEHSNDGLRESLDSKNLDKHYERQLRYNRDLDNTVL